MKILSCVKKVERLKNGDIMSQQHITDLATYVIEVKNSAVVSRVISDAIKAKSIRCHDASVGSKARKYLPWWA